MKYMLIMRAVDQRAVENFESTDVNEVIAAMGAYNESMVDAGVLADGAGLSDAEEGSVVDFSDDDPVVTDGPYGELRELFNGFWSSTSRPRRRRSSGPSAHRSAPAPNWRSAVSTTSTTSHRTTSGSRKNRNGSTKAS